MKDWFDSLQAREKKLVMVAAVLLVALLLYMVVWRPAANEYKRLATSISDKEKQLLEMEQLAAEAKLLQRNQPKSATIQAGRSLLGVIDSTAKANQLGEALKRVRPNGENKASVSLDDAQFDKVVRWLELLQRQQGVQIVTSNIEKQDKDGMVSVRLELQGSNGE